MTQCPLKFRLLKETKNEIPCVHTQMKCAMNTYSHTCCISLLRFPRGIVSCIFCVPSNIPCTVVMRLNVGGYHRQTFSTMTHLRNFV